MVPDMAPVATDPGSSQLCVPAAGLAPEATATMNGNNIAILAAIEKSSPTIYPNPKSTHPTMVFKWSAINRTPLKHHRV